MVTLFVVVLLVIAAALSVGMLVKRQRDLQREIRQVHLQSLLDSGAALALARFTENRDFAGPENLELDGGEVRISVFWETNTRRSVNIIALYQNDDRQATATLYVPVNGRPTLVDWKYGPPPRLR